jgi:hypothetical protein
MHKWSSKESFPWASSALSCSVFSLDFFAHSPVSLVTQDGGKVLEALEHQHHLVTTFVCHVEMSLLKDAKAGRGSWRR